VQPRGAAYDDILRQLKLGEDAARPVCFAVGAVPPKDTREGRRLALGSFIRAFKASAMLTAVVNIKLPDDTIITDVSTLHIADLIFKETTRTSDVLHIRDADVLDFSPHGCFARSLDLGTMTGLNGQTSIFGMLVPFPPTAAMLMAAVDADARSALLDAATETLHLFKPSAEMPARTWISQVIINMYKHGYIYKRYGERHAHVTLTMYKATMSSDDKSILEGIDTFIENFPNIYNILPDTTVTEMRRSPLLVDTRRSRSAPACLLLAHARS
jgi:hypothetical protein